MSDFSCDEVLAEIERFIDGEMDVTRSVQLAQHLSECSPCLDRADFKKNLKEIVRRKCASSNTATPDRLVTRVRLAIRTERVERHITD
jgi:mycothiol system anti-sigma-R factor